MGWSFLDIEELPAPGDIVWCKFPLRERPGAPSPVVRPVLVRESFNRIDDKSGQRFGSLIVSYGTGEFDRRHDGIDLIIKNWARVKALGLHKPTRFSLDPSSRKHLLWCEEFFAPPRYIVGCGIHLGRLNEEEFAQARECLVRRGIAAE